MSTTTETKTQPTFGEIMDKAAKSALRGGTAGAVAMGLNVGALMWMRTTVRCFTAFVIFFMGYYEMSPSHLFIHNIICLFFLMHHLCAFT